MLDLIAEPARDVAERIGVDRGRIALAFRYFTRQPLGGIRDLAASLEFYKNDLVRNNRSIMFPQGAYPRTFDAERGSQIGRAHV